MPALPASLVPVPAPEPLSLRRVFVRDLIMPCRIGVHAHEALSPQRVRLNLQLDVVENDVAINDDLRNVVCYDEIITAVRALIAEGHVRLLETLVEKIAQVCLADIRIRTVRVELEKLDVYQDIAAVGIAIERHNSRLYGAIER